MLDGAWAVEGTSLSAFAGARGGVGCGMRQMLFLAAVFCAATVRADLLSMSNGDRYHGAIQLVNEKEVHLQSEILGLIKIPRTKVTAIQFGDVKETAAPVAKASSAAASDQLGFDPKAVEKVQQEFLGTATPEANAMFSEMLQGLSSGKISVNDIRSQAMDTLKQLKELQAELGEEGDNSLLATYGSILEKFVRAGGTNLASTNAAPKIKAPAVKLLGDEE